MEGTQERSIYVNQSHGKFQRLAMPGDDITKLITVTKEDGGKYDVIQFTYIEGYIFLFSHITRSYAGKDRPILQVHMRAEGHEDRILQINWLSKSASDILARMENIDYTRPVKIFSGYDAETGKAFIYIKQDGEKVPLNYTSTQPRDRPAWQQVVINGETKWDRTEELNWWGKKITEVNFHINKLAKQSEPSKNLKTQIMTHPPPVHHDDLPF